MTLQEHLKSIRACNEARSWAGDRSAKQAWEECERADWLLWWAAKTEVNSRCHVVLAACACARRALRFVPEGEQRPRLAIEAAEAWAVEQTEQSRAARAAARAAAWAASRAAASDAASDAAWAAWAAARAAAWDAAWDAEHREMCVIVRKLLVIPWTEENSK